MFLAEVALGREKHIDRDNHTLTKPPDGHDSIVARGQTEPGKLCEPQSYFYDQKLFLFCLVLYVYCSYLLSLVYF